MIAAKTVYLNADRTKAVAEGDKDARSLLVREGGEISDETVAKYEGAAALLGGAKKAPRAEPVVETREPAVTTRDPRPAPKRRR